MHKRLMDPVLARMDAAQSAYFDDVARSLSDDKRIERNSNLVFAFLAAAAPYLTTQLPKVDFIGRLIAFVERNEHRIFKTVFDPRYLSGRDLIKPVVGEFVMETAAQALAKLDAGDIDEDGSENVYRLSWPFDAEDFPYDDLDEDDETKND